MKYFAIFAIVITIASAVQIKSSADLALEAKLKQLKKTGWGKVAIGLMELQLQTGGPLSELVTAFQNLIKDLNFKLASEQEEYRWAKAEHFELDKEINVRLRDATVRFGVATSHLQNTLYPQRQELEHMIAQDEQLIADTEAAIAKATRERAEAQTVYENFVIEHVAALDAVNECIQLVAGLQAGGSFVQVKKAQTHLKKLTAQLKGTSSLGHLAKALVEMAQDFANKQATAKVRGLLQDLKENLVQSRFAADADNVAQIGAFEHFLDVSNKTIVEANARLDTNNAELEVVNAAISHQEGLRDQAAEDRDTAQDDLDEETARWATSVEAYEDLIAELEAELTAIDKVIELFSTAQISDSMMDRIDW